MHKLFTLTFIFIGLLTFAYPSEVKAQPNLMDIYSQTEKDYNNIISYQPFSIFINGLGLSYEKKLKKKFSGKIMGRYVLTESSNYFSLDDAREYLTEIQTRFYLGNTDKSLNGFYAMPYVRYKQVKGKNTVLRENDSNDEVEVTKNIRANAVSGGVALGLQFITQAQLSLDMYIGGHLRAAFNDNEKIGKNNDLNINSYSQGAYFNLGVNFGVAF